MMTELENREHDDRRVESLNVHVAGLSEFGTVHSLDFWR